MRKSINYFLLITKSEEVSSKDYYFSFWVNTIRLTAFLLLNWLISWKCCFCRRPLFNPLPRVLRHNDIVYNNYFF